MPGVDGPQRASGSDIDDDSDDENAQWPFKGALWSGTIRCTAAGTCSAVVAWVDCSLSGEEWCESARQGSSDL
jgi:hypothetical protein